jgi:hypothetical protein
MPFKKNFKKRFIYFIDVEVTNPKNMNGTPSCVTSWRGHVQEEEITW